MTGNTIPCRLLLKKTGLLLVIHFLTEWEFHLYREITADLWTCVDNPRVQTYQHHPCVPQDLHHLAVLPVHIHLATVLLYFCRFFLLNLFILMQPLVLHLFIQLWFLYWRELSSVSQILFYFICWICEIIEISSSAGLTDLYTHSSYLAWMCNNLWVT